MIELIIQLDSSLNIPLYEQIYSHIKTEIKEGRLCENMKLPSTRAMAAT
ncbi:MAG: GntR family transcriptional regulator, partial [Lachnospiraceae bacterium]|nr:GntR family transcriptional regulator [Lachnospiraceae bacterium]